MLIYQMNVDKDKHMTGYCLDKTQWNAVTFCISALRTIHDFE